MAEKPVDVRDVQVQTCTVTIKAIMLNNKQMTLSVFRQLPLTYLPLLSLRRDLMWGTVNYCCLPACKRFAGSNISHVHVVHQAGNVIFHSPALSPSPCGFYSMLHLSPSGRLQRLVARDPTEEEFARMLDQFEFLESLPQLFIAV